jgi:hypothetical protein
MTEENKPVQQTPEAKEPSGLPAFWAELKRRHVVREWELSTPW